MTAGDDIDFGRVLVSVDGSDRLMVIVQKSTTQEVVCLDLNEPSLTTISNRLMLMRYNLLPEAPR